MEALPVSKNVLSGCKDVKRGNFVFQYSAENRDSLMKYLTTGTNFIMICITIVLSASALILAIWMIGKVELVNKEH